MTITAAQLQRALFEAIKANNGDGRYESAEVMVWKQTLEALASNQIIILDRRQRYDISGDFVNHYTQEDTKHPEKI